MKAINNLIKRAMPTKRRIFKIMIILVILLITAASGGYAFLRQAKFGLNPHGEHLAKIIQSPNYRDGEFKNLIELPIVMREDSRVTSLLKYLLSERERPSPPQAVPSIKTDLKILDKNRDLAIWLGHSSYFFQLKGRGLV